MNYKVISKTCTPTGNSWNFVKVVSISTKKIRVKIKRDAYDVQSHAVVELWANNRWNNVHHVPIEKCHSRNISHVQDKVNESLFEKDFKNLLNVAKKIIF